eukprot:m.85816 g.85816  ORF g.85816 m.85816 type:complete len:140 (+) comp13026_c0_seq1:185-604(+)
MATYPQQPPLPDGWECRFDNNSRRYYYLDHHRQYTTFLDPRNKNGMAVINVFVAIRTLSNDAHNLIQLARHVRGAPSKEHKLERNRVDEGVTQQMLKLDLIEIDTSTPYGQELRVHRKEALRQLEDLGKQLQQACSHWG